MGSTIWTFPINPSLTYITTDVNWSVVKTSDLELARNMVTLWRGKERTFIG
jgi:hypothetical protein